MLPATAGLRKVCDVLVAPEYRAAVKTFMDLASITERMAHDDILDTEYKMVDGSWHRLSFLVKKRDETGRVTHVLCAVRSISDVKRRELDLVYQADAAKREGEMKARFLSNMSHDIRTPLNGVIELPFAIGEQNAIHPEEQNFDEIPVAGIRALRECMSENDVLKLSDEL